MRPTAKYPECCRLTAELPPPAFEDKALATADPDSYCGRMKHLTFSDKSLLVDDATADAIIDYAALLTQHQSGDAVGLHVFGSDGDETDAKILLGPGASIMVETAHTSLPGPDNAEALAYVRQKMAELTARPSAVMDDGPLIREYEDEF